MLDKAILPVWTGGWVELVECRAECVFGSTYNKPVLCLLVSVLMSGKEAVALSCFVPASSQPYQNSFTLASSSRGILEIIQS